MRYCYQDWELVWTGATALTYQILAMPEETVVSSGTAINYGDGFGLYPNRIVEGLLSPGKIDFTTGVTSQPTMAKRIRTFLPTEDEVVDDSWYIYGFCGDFGNAASGALSDPVNGKLDPRMFFFYTFATTDNQDLTIEEA